jgi:hypothetical protein
MMGPVKSQVEHWPPGRLGRESGHRGYLFARIVQERK